MNKRISKKLHKKYLNDDVVLEISTSSLWRQRLFDSNYGEKFIISSKNLKEVPKWIIQPVVKYKLKYQVYKTDEMLNEEIYYEGGVFFKFEPVKFKRFSDFSFNNTGVI